MLLGHLLSLLLFPSALLAQQATTFTDLTGASPTPLPQNCTTQFSDETTGLPVVSVEGGDVSVRVLGATSCDIDTAPGVVTQPNYELSATYSDFTLASLLGETERELSVLGMTSEKSSLALTTFLVSIIDAENNDRFFKVVTVTVNSQGFQNDAIIAELDIPSNFEMDARHDWVGEVVRQSGRVVAVVGPGIFVIPTVAVSPFVVQGCFPDMPYRTKASPATQAPVASFGRAVLTADGKFLAVSSISLQHLTYLSKDIGRSGCVVTDNGKTRWPSGLEQNFVVVFDVDMLLAGKCQMTDTDSPVVHFEPTCFQPSRGLAFSERAVSLGWVLVYSNGSFPFKGVHINPTPTFFWSIDQAIAQRDSRCNHTCSLLPESDSRTCIDHGGYLETSTQASCGQIMSEIGTCEYSTEQQTAWGIDFDIVHLSENCQASCHICQEPVFTGTICDGYKNWDCQDCAENVFNASLCRSDGCLSETIERSFGTTVVSRCTSLCESQMEACQSSQATEEQVLPVCEISGDTWEESDCGVDPTQLLEAAEVSAFYWDAELFLVAYRNSLLSFNPSVSYWSDVITTGTVAAVPSLAEHTVNRRAKSMSSTGTGALVGVRYEEGESDSDSEWDVFDPAVGLRKLPTIGVPKNTIASIVRTVFWEMEVWSDTPQVASLAQPRQSSSPDNHLYVIVSFTDKISSFSAEFFEATQQNGQQADVTVSNVESLVTGYSWGFDVVLNDIADGPLSFSMRSISGVTFDGVSTAHTHHLDRERPQVNISVEKRLGDRYCTENQTSCFGTHSSCDVLTKLSLTTIVFNSTEAVTPFCVSGNQSTALYRTEQEPLLDVIIQPDRDSISSASSSLACEGPICDQLDQGCVMNLITTCQGDCSYTITVPAGSLFDAAGNPNHLSDKFVICFDDVSPTITFLEEVGGNKTAQLSIPNPGNITMTFSEKVEFQGKGIHCDQCTVLGIHEIQSDDNNTSLFFVEVEFQSVQFYSLQVFPGAFLDLAGNGNLFDELTLAPLPVHSVLTDSAFSAVLSLDAVFILLLIVTSCLIFKHRASPVVKASTPLFSQLILFGLLCVVLANLSFAFAFHNKEKSQREMACDAALHLCSLGASLFLGPLMARNFRVMRVVHNPKLKSVKITNTQMLSSVSVLVVVVELLMLLWNVLYGSVSEVRDPSVNSFYECAYLHNNGAFVLATVMTIFAVIYVAGCFILFRIFGKHVAGPFNETRPIAFAFYNVICVGVMFGIVQGFTQTSDATLALLTFAQLYFVLCPLLVLFWLTKLLLIFQKKDVESRNRRSTGGGGGRRSTGGGGGGGRRSTGDVPMKPLLKQSRNAGDSPTRAEKMSLPTSGDGGMKEATATLLVDDEEAKELEAGEETAQDQSGEQQGGSFGSLADGNEPNSNVV